MKTFVKSSRERGLTLVELFVVLAVASFLSLVFIFLPSSNIKTRAPRIQCVNNLKQIGMAARVWEADHGGKYPFNVSETNGGSMKFTDGPNAWRHFQVMSNELGTPKVLICSAESDRKRKWTTNFATLSNSNLSYFINLNASETDPQAILSGDRNITNGTPIKNGIFELTTNSPAGWTAELHNHVGNLALSDGSVQQVSETGLRAFIENTSVFTNRLQMPVLGP